MKPEYESRPFVNWMREGAGLLAVAAADNVMRVLPPLIITEEHIHEFVSKLSAAADEYKAEIAG